MAFCGKCGNQLEEGAKFCPKCGTSVENNETQLNEENSALPKKRMIKPFDLGDWLFLPVFIVFLIAIIFFVTLSFPNLHCKLFSWFPYFETPSVVAYKYITCAKEGDIDGMMEYSFMKDYPSRTKMKKNLAELDKSSTATTPTRKVYIDSNNQLHDFTEEATKKDYIELFNTIHLVSGQNTEIQDFSIESEETKGSLASVVVLYKLKNGEEEKKYLNLRKDEEGVWGFYFNSGVKDAMRAILDKEKKKQEKKMQEKKKQLENNENRIEEQREMSESKSQTASSSEKRLFRNKDDVYMNFVSQTFVDNSGLKIRFGGNGEMEIDGDYAGIARVKSYNLQRAILKYSGGVYGEGFIILSIEGGTAKLFDPNDPSTVWYRKGTF